MVFKGIAKIVPILGKANGYEPRLLPIPNFPSPCSSAIAQYRHEFAKVVWFCVEIKPLGKITIIRGREGGMHGPLKTYSKRATAWRCTMFRLALRASSLFPLSLEASHAFSTDP